MPNSVSIFPVAGLPEIEPGVDLGAMIAAAFDLAAGDVVVVTSKIVSKAENCIVELDAVTPSTFARQWADRWDKDPRVIEVVLTQSARLVRQSGPVLISETHHGFVCANAGVDQSSAGAQGRVLTLPPDTDASAAHIRAAIAATGKDVAVIVTDTFGRPWREGQTDIAIGVSGMDPLRSYIGEVDPHGHEFLVQVICVADEIAAAAELVQGNNSRVPVSVIRGYDYEPSEHASMRAVLRDPGRDLFR